MLSKEEIRSIWPEWEIGAELGSGSFGTVYEAVRSDHSVKSTAAIKLISIPGDEDAQDDIDFPRLDKRMSETYYRGIMEEFVGEIQIMESLKGTQNIVNVEDYEVIKKKDGEGFDILIRMELLTPLPVYLRSHTMDEAEIVKLGCDLCSALEICARRSVIHRDIKPENIFINDFGHFKLGDFGVAKSLENSEAALSEKGTDLYKAPEMIMHKPYDARADIYSLGLVLYRLLNDNRVPFLNNKQIASPKDRYAAFERRLNGEALPAPCRSSPAVSEVILRACAFAPEDRFSSAAEMKAALLKASSDPRPGGDGRPSETAEPRSDASAAYPVRDLDAASKRKRRRISAMIAAALALIIVGACVLPRLTKQPDTAEKMPSSAEEQLHAAPVPDEQETAPVQTRPFPFRPK